MSDFIAAFCEPFGGDAERFKFALQSSRIARSEKYICAGTKAVKPLLKGDSGPEFPDRLAISGAADQDRIQKG